MRSSLASSIGDLLPAMTPPPMGKPTITIAQVRRAVWVKLAITFPTPAIAMPSFDVVSEVDKHELTNAVDTANRELGNRFDFKGCDARFELNEGVVTQIAPSDFQQIGRASCRERVCQYGEIP